MQATTAASQTRTRRLGWPRHDRTSHLWTGPSPPAAASELPAAHTAPSLVGLAAHQRPPISARRSRRCDCKNTAQGRRARPRVAWVAQAWRCAAVRRPQWRKRRANGRAGERDAYTCTCMCACVRRGRARRRCTPVLRAAARCVREEVIHLRAPCGSVMPS